MKKIIVSRELLTFLVVGCVATAVNYGIFALLYTQFQLFYLLASAIGFLSGSIVGYILNKRFTFQDARDFQITVFLGYILVNFVSLILSLILLEILVKLGLNPLIANVFCIGLSATTNYMGIKRFVFLK